MAWIRTYTGRNVYPLAPHEDDIDIHDIAHSLSMQCRFGGHTREFYSVAQHCVSLCERVRGTSDDDALAVLLHDASEAYLIDFPRPVKSVMPGYAKAEAMLTKVINSKYGVIVDARKASLIKKLDNAILYDESRELFPHGEHFVDRVFDVPPFRIDPWEPQRAKRAFLYLFNTITKGAFL